MKWYSTLMFLFRTTLTFKRHHCQGHMWPTASEQIKLNSQPAVNICTHIIRETLQWLIDVSTHSVITNFIMKCKFLEIVNKETIQLTLSVNCRDSKRGHRMHRRNLLHPPNWNTKFLGRTMSSQERCHLITIQLTVVSDTMSTTRDCFIWNNKI